VLVANPFFASPHLSLWVAERENQAGLLLYLIVGGVGIYLTNPRRTALPSADVIPLAAGIEATAQREAEESLRKHQARLLDHAFDPILTWKLGGAITYWNAGAARLYGYSADEAVGRISHELLRTVFPVSRDACENTLRRDGHWEGELLHRTKDGLWVPVDSRMTLVQQTGGPPEVQEANRDLTERKMADEAREQLASIVESSEDAIVSKTLDGVIRTWNTGAERLFGHTRAEAVGRSITIIIPPERLAEGHDILARIRGGERVEPFETVRVAKDGRRIDVSLTVSPVRDGNGHVIGASKIVRDVTGRRRAEEALRLQDRAIQAASEGILITDPHRPDNPIVFASPGFERMTGYPSAEAVGRNSRFLQGKGTDPHSVALFHEGIAAGRGCSAELLNYRKDGTPFWNALSVTPVHDDAGTLTHFVGVQVDVTERRKLEEQFRQAQKMEAVGQLAGGVAHDFNNLLTVINGYSELLLDNPAFAGAAQEVLTTIRDAGERAAALTRQLLAFSRRSVLEPRVFDPNGVVAETGKMLTRLIGEDVHLTMTLNPRVSRVRVDPAQFGQVIMNLAVNARDAMPTGGRLTIETSDVEWDESAVRGRTDMRPGRYVLVSVTDTGTGMPPDVKARVFEPFFTTKELGKGTGLGLATVFGIVKQSDGHVEVYSEDGVGTSFKLYLPAVADDERAVGAEPPGVEGGTESILLVEDQADVRLLAAIALQSKGYHVIEASSGAEVMKLVGQARPPVDMLLTDVVMPGMSGRLVAEALRPLYPGLRVLYMSGYTDDAVVRHGVVGSGDAFLHKPFTPLGLARKVREVLDRSVS
jgi:PAS domain S-box-containing protein